VYLFIWGNGKGKGKGKVKTYPRACYEGLWDSGGTTPLILNLGTSSR